MNSFLHRLKLRGNLPLAKLSDPLRNLLSSGRVWRALIYVASSIAQKGGHLLLLPLLVSSLSAEDFTRYGLLASLFALLPYLATLNLHLAPSRLYFDYPTRSKATNLVKTSFFAGVGTAVLLLLSILLLGNLLLGARLNDLVGGYELQLMVFVFVLSVAAVQFSGTLARVRGQALAFSGISTSQSFALLTSFALLIELTSVHPFRALIFSYGAAGFVSGTVALAFANRDLRTGTICWSLLPAILRFSLPTVIHIVAMWIILSSGRWIGLWFFSLKELAPYILLVQVVSAASLVTRAMFDSRLPDIGTAFAQGNISHGRSILRKTTILATGIATFGYVLLFGFFSIVSIPALEPYALAPTLLASGLFANLADAVYMEATQALSAMKRTAVQAAGSIFGGVLSVLATILLTQLFGLLGLVLGTVVGYALLALSTQALARRQVARVVR